MGYTRKGDFVGYDFEKIIGAVQELESEKRFRHTLGVQKEACELGKIFMPQMVEKLGLAGLLHDITKDFSFEKQLELCKDFGIVLDNECIVPKLLHAKTGCELAKRLFGDDVVDDEVYSGIFYHTTGRKGMTLFETIIYLADYIEEGRTFSDCIELRNFFYDNVKKANDYSDKLEVLRKTMVYSFDLTICNLIDEGKLIDQDTVNARNYFLLNKNVFNMTEE